MIESGLAVPVQEQFREGEWRTNLVASLGGMLFTITVSTGDGDDYERNGSSDEETEGNEVWQDSDPVVRIISARAATADEQILYIEARPSEWE